MPPHLKPVISEIDPCDLWPNYSEDLIRLSSCSDLIKFEVHISSDIARLRPICYSINCPLWPLTYFLKNLIRSSSYGDTYYHQVWSWYLKWFLIYCDNGEAGRTGKRTVGRTDNPKTWLWHHLRWRRHKYTLLLLNTTPVKLSNNSMWLAITSNCLKYFTSASII